MPTLESCLNKPLIYDVDDAVWLGKPFGKAMTIHAARNAEVVVAGNAYLADWYSQYAKRVEVIPTAIDTERFVPAAGGKKAGEFIIGWIGTSANYKYLCNIEEPLALFLHSHHDAKLLIVSDKAPALPALPQEQVMFRRWSEDNEVQLIQSMAVGIMPLEDTEWCRGKCSYKMLQYMACEKPVVVSPVGMNAEILQMGEVGLSAKNNDDWYEALRMYYREPLFCELHGLNGRRVTNRTFGPSIVMRKIVDVLHMFR